MGILKDFGRSFLAASGAVIKGPPQKSIARADFIGRKPVENTKVSLFGVLGQVAGGVKTNKDPGGYRAPITGREKWGYLYKKAQEKQKPAVKENIFTMAKRTSLTRKQAAWYFNEYLKRNENKSLKMKLLRYNPKAPGESDLVWAKRVQDKWFGGVNEYASPWAGKVGISIEQTGDRAKVESRIKRVLEPEMRKEKHFKPKEWDKLSISTLKDVTGYSKN
jgi:hypothetical protein